MGGIGIGEKRKEDTVGLRAPITMILIGTIMFLGSE
jgi:hypothetical protein